VFSDTYANAEMISIQFEYGSRGKLAQSLDATRYSKCVGSACSPQSVPSVCKGCLQWKSASIGVVSIERDI